MSNTHIDFSHGFELGEYDDTAGNKRARIFTLGYGERVEMEAVEETEADAVKMLAQRIRDRIEILGEMLEIVEGVKLNE